VLPFMVGVVCVSLAMLCSLLIRPLVEPNPFLLFFAAIAITAWYGGLWPSVLATVLSAICVNYYFLEPYYSFVPSGENIARLIGFIIVAALISALSESRRIASNKAFARSEEWSVTLSSIGDAIIVTDVAGKVTFLNQVAERLTGWPSSEAKGQAITTVFQIINVTTRQTVPNPVERVLKEGIVVGLANHTLLISRDGSERPIDDSGAPIRDRQGRLIGSILVFRDISEQYTARAETEAALQKALRSQQLAEEAGTAARASRDQLQLIADNLPVLIAYIDPQLIYRFNNKAYEEWFGLARNAITGTSMREVLGETALATIKPYLEQALAGETVHFETLVRYRYGGTRFIEATYKPDKSEQGTVRGAILLVEDVTTRKRREEGQQLLVKAGDLLATGPHETRALKQIVQIAVPVFADYAIIYLLDDERRISRVAFAHSDPEKQHLVDAFQQLHPVDPASQTTLAQVLRSGKLFLVEQVTEQTRPFLNTSTEYIALLDELNPQSYMVVPLLARERLLGALYFAMADSQRHYSPNDLPLAEELSYRISLALDNAELYQAERQARVEAEKAVQVRETFLSVASHELKTPLTSLLMQAQLLQRRSVRNGILSERDQRSLQVITDQAQRLDRMISTLLDISRIERGQLTITRAPFAIDQLLQRVIAELQSVSETHTLVYESSAEEVLINADELRIEQVLQNLLQNAIKYSPNGGNIHVMLEIHNGEVVIRVHDRGIGIPTADLPYLFTRFYRATNADPQRISGVGIGLYIVHEIVTLHGGTIQIESEEGTGSTVSVHLPRMIEYSNHV
jgi:PAS domain S-box-containing protein